MARTEYSGFAKLLHWLIALVIAGMVGLGVYMTEVQGDFQYKLWLYQLHKSFGVTLFGLLVIRLVWRQIAPPPALPAAMPAWERRASRLAHIGLYVLMFAIPLSGWVRVSASPLSVPTQVFGLFNVPHIPFLAGLPKPDKEALEPVFQTVHWALAWTLVALVAVHASAALRHAFVLRDDVMTRMLPRLSRRKTASLCITALVTVGLLTAVPAYAAEWTIQPEDSRITFSGSAAGQTIEGQFREFSGIVQFDPDNPDAAKAEITIRMSSLETGNSDVDGTLPGESWFHMSEYPQAVFTADGATQADGEGAYVLSGTLTLKGKTSDVEVPFTIDIEGDTARVEGEVVINRLDYGVGPDGPISGITVSDEVTVGIAIQARQQ